MSNYLCINKSGYSIPVWSGPGYAHIENIHRIGTIGVNEIFAFIGDAGGDGVFNNIQFMNSSGALVTGWLTNCDSSGNAIVSDTNWENVFRSYVAERSGTDTINGSTYKTFNFRRSEEIYTPGGTLWGSVASGRRVAFNEAVTGTTHPSWKLINYVERASDGVWIPVTGESGTSYGYVDSGLNVGSGVNTISMY